MARSTSRASRARIRQLEAQLAATQAELREVGGLSKSTSSMAGRPVPQTSRSQVYPVYPSEIPRLEPWRMPQQFGAFNRGTLYSSYGGGVSFDLLRLAARRAPLLTTANQICTHDLLQLSEQSRAPKQVGWRIQHVQADRDDVDTDTPEVRARCERVAKILRKPHPKLEPTFRGFLSRVMDDYLTINRVAVEVIRDQRGRVVQFSAVDGATILPTMALLQRYIALQGDLDPSPWAYDVAGRALEAETGEEILGTDYVCVMRGQLVGSFTESQLLVWEDMPITDVRVLFPPSYVEKALETVVSWLYAFHSNRTYFSNGNPTEVMIGLKGIDDDGFVAFEEEMRENYSGIKGFWRVPLIQLPMDGAVEVIRLKENHREMQFQEWMATLQSLVLAGIYRVSTRRAELQSGGGENNGQLFGQNQVEYVEASKEESFRIHSAFIKQHLTELVQMMDPDLEFAWSGIDLEDEEQISRIEQIEVTTYMTVNEIRARHNQEPFETPWGDLPLNQLIHQAEGLGQQAQGGEGGRFGDAGDAAEGQGQPPAPGSQNGQNGTQAPEGSRSLAHMAGLEKALGWEEVTL